MSRSVLQRVRAISDAIERCQRYLGHLDAGDATEDIREMAGDAIERNLQVIGEAVSRLPESVTVARPGIPWPQIRGFRNILVHEYLGVDPDTIREVVESHLPQWGRRWRAWRASTDRS